MRFFFFFYTATSNFSKILTVAVHKGSVEPATCNALVLWDGQHELLQQTSSSLVSMRNPCSL